MDFVRSIIADHRRPGPKIKTKEKEMRKLLATVFAFCAVAAYPDCIGDAGHPVDSWFMIKAPHGTDVIYYEKDYKGFQHSKHSANDTTVGALGQTMQQLWKHPELEYVLFNDEIPGSTTYNFSVGHSKGIWMWDTTQQKAVVLQHSTPKFPQGPQSSPTYLGLGSNAWMNGQHFACFSMSLSALETIAKPAQLTVAQIYEKHISDSTPATLTEFANGSYLTEAVCVPTDFRTATLNVTYFAKSRQWDKKLYADCIGPSLRSNLFVESWIRGSQCPCGIDNIYDIDKLDFGSGFKFSEYNDHSKWAVNDGTVCPSDINRMTTQEKRGGSAFCFGDRVLAASLKKAIVGLKCAGP